MVTAGNIGGVNSRSPHGERGLKFKLGLDCILDGVALLTESLD